MRLAAATLGLLLIWAGAVWAQTFEDRVLSLLEEREARFLDADALSLSLRFKPDAVLAAEAETLGLAPEDYRATAIAGYQVSMEIYIPVSWTAYFPERRSGTSAEMDWMVIPHRFALRDRSTCEVVERCTSDIYFGQADDLWFHPFSRSVDQMIVLGVYPEISAALQAGVPDCPVPAG